VGAGIDPEGVVAAHVAAGRREVRADLQQLRLLGLGLDGLGGLVLVRRVVGFGQGVGQTFSIARASGADSEGLSESRGLRVSGVSVAFDQ